MNKVKTLDDLRKMRETLRSTLDIREKSNHPEHFLFRLVFHSHYFFRGRLRIYFCASCSICACVLTGF